MVIRGAALSSLKTTIAQQLCRMQVLLSPLLGWGVWEKRAKREPDAHKGGSVLLPLGAPLSALRVREAGALERAVAWTDDELAVCVKSDFSMLRMLKCDVPGLRYQRGRR